MLLKVTLYTMYKEINGPIKGLLRKKKNIYIEKHQNKN